MSTDRTSTADESRLAVALRRLTGWAVAQSTAVLAAAIGLAVLAAAFAAIRLGVRTNRDALLDTYSDAAHAWREHQREFGAAEDVIVAVESLDQVAADAAAAELATAIRREEELFHFVLHTLDLSPLRSKALYYVNLPELAANHRQLARLAPLFRGDWSVISLDRLSPASPVANGASAAAHNLDEQFRLQASLRAALAGEAYVSPWLPLPSVIDDWQRLDAPLALAELPGLLLPHETTSPNIAALRSSAETEGPAALARSFVALRLQTADSGGPPSSKSLVVLQTVVDQVASRHPATRIGLTGVPVLEQDERGGTRFRVLTAGLLSLLAAAVVLAAGCGGARYAAAVVATLGLALAASFGWATLAVGHVDALSASFPVIVVALGCGGCILFVHHYLRLRRDEVAPADALADSAAAVGPLLLIAAGVVALVLFALALAQSPGVAEIGVVLGGGVLLCGLAALVVLPALLFKLDHRGGVVPEALSLDWALRLVQSPRRAPAMLVLAAALSVAAGAGLFRLRYEDDFHAAQDDNVESAALDQRLRVAGAHPGVFIACHAESRAELLARKAELEKLPHVEHVEEIASLLPESAAEYQPLIQNIHDRLRELPDRPPVIPLTLAGERRGLELALAVNGSTIDSPTADGTRSVTATWDGTTTFAARLYNWQQQIAADLLARLHALKRAADPQPPTLADLPPELVERFAGETGRHLLRVFPRAAGADGPHLAAFVDEVRGIDPQATGHPVVSADAAKAVRVGVTTAALYALPLVLIVVVLALGNLRDALLSLLPLGLGLVQALGLLGWLGESLSPANLLALPVILASAAACGALVMSDLRRLPDSQKADHVCQPLVNSMVMGSLVAIAAGGSLLFAEHQGWQSLGRVLVVGLGCSCLTSLFVLPAVATWLKESQATPSDAREAILRLAAPPADDERIETSAPAAIPLRIAEPRRKAA